VLPTPLISKAKGQADDGLEEDIKGLFVGDDDGLADEARDIRGSSEMVAGGAVVSAAGEVVVIIVVAVTVMAKLLKRPGAPTSLERSGSSVTPVGQVRDVEAAAVNAPISLGGPVSVKPVEPMAPATSVVPVVPIASKPPIESVKPMGLVRVLRDWVFFPKRATIKKRRTIRIVPATHARTRRKGRPESDLGLEPAPVAGAS